MIEWALKCSGCGLLWIVFGNKPGTACVFCDSPLIKAKRHG